MRTNDPTARPHTRAFNGTDPAMTPTPAVASLHACHDHLLQAVLDASAAAASLTGARQARAHELLTMLDAAITHCERLATVAEGDHRAEATTR